MASLHSRTSQSFCREAKKEVSGDYEWVRVGASQGFLTTKKSSVIQNIKMVWLVPRGEEGDIPPRCRRRSRQHSEQSTCTSPLRMRKRRRTRQRLRASCVWSLSKNKL